MACDGYTPGAQFRVAVQGRWNDVSDVINSYQMYFVSSGTIDIDDVQLDLADYFSDLYDLVKAICNVVTVWNGITIEELDGDCSTGLVTFTSAISGALSNDAYAPGVAAMLAFPTGVKRRTLRKYFGGLDESVIGPTGGISGGFNSAIDAIGQFLVAPQTYNGRTWRNSWKRPDTGEVLFPLSSVRSNVPAYQRRRKQGSGS